MASISANGAKGNHKFTLTVTEKSTSTENNTSLVEFSFKLSPVNTSWNWELWGSSISYKVTINGTDYTGTIPDYDGYSTVTLKTGSQTVSHNADGTKTIAYSFSVTDGAGQRYTPGNASASGSLTLTTIPRATTPTLSATSVTANNTNGITITISPASSTFKHKIRYDFGTLKGYVSGFKVDGTSIGFDFVPQGKNVFFTPPTLLLNEIPSANSGVCTILLYTYTSSGTHIGTKSVNLTINVPSYTPSVSTPALVGNNLLSGAYVQGKSTVTATITASSSYGATIKSYSSTVDGKTYTGSKFTSSALSDGSKNVIVTVTDTRGKTATVTSSAFEVYEYSAPSIKKFTVERQSDGTTVIATVRGSVSAVNNKNSKNVTVTLNGKTQTITSSEYTINGTTTFTGVPTDNTLTATAKIWDSYTATTPATKDAVLPTVAVTMDFHYSGKGIAMGKVAEHPDFFDLDWNLYCRKNASINTATFAPLTINRTDSVNGAAIKFVNTNGTLGFVGMADEANSGLRRWTANSATAYVMLDTGNTNDFVVEQGTNGIWTYRKWNSGIAECWGNVSTTPTTVNGSNAVSVNLPFIFVGTDYKVNISPAKAAMYVTSFGDCATNGIITHTTSSFTMAYKYSYGTAYAVSFNVNVYGKWK
jgi:hypothetical protein